MQFIHHNSIYHTEASWSVAEDTQTLSRTFEGVSEFPIVDRPGRSPNLHPKTNRADSAATHTTSTHLNLVLDSESALNSETPGCSSRF